MSASKAKQTAGSLRRTRSAGDDPQDSITLQVVPSQIPEASTSSSVVISVPKNATTGHHSAGPTFNAFSIPELPEDDPVRTPPPAVHRPHSTPAPSNALPSNITLDLPRRPVHPANISRFTRVLLFFGYGPNASRRRRAKVSLIWALCWGFTQLVTIIVVLAISAPNPSSTIIGTSEWTACDRPLGAWSVLWLFRVIMVCMLAYWGWTADKSTLTTNPTRHSRDDLEVGQSPPQSGPMWSPTQSHPGPSSLSGTSTQTEHTRPRQSATFRRASLFCSLYSLTWFLTGNILVYTSVHTCRFSSPHIWWLVFGILCITYMMILEVVILGLIVFIFAPVVFIVWNVFLLCIGRHPLQNPHMIKPDIGKLPKNLVDQIPLVIYIPPPPDAAPTEGPIKIPESVYSYPPKMVAKQPDRKRFKFIKFKKLSKPGRNSSNNEKSVERHKSIGPVPWEDNWDTEGYPFVVLDNNRAACAICLLDFEEPKRLHPAPETQTKEAAAPVEPKPKEGDAASQAVEVISEEERGDNLLRLADAGEGAQPLRLLTCGHVFHVRFPFSFHRCHSLTLTSFGVCRKLV
ncbi:hypothetical protein D9757_000585 [Collybiopsis confluens]|uniref:Uncharacterized protein n=1 Tax=Collybiopsis confluens TaxID=2823264 RepID=A0A8H5I148_9AGAR|nr:hypothetical protein D9757_000585 [Collybiopsis confluens]